MVGSLLRMVLGPPAQCIWFFSSFPPAVYDFEIVICQSLYLSDLPLVPNFCCEEMVQILVVGVYRHGFIPSYQVLVPFLKSF